jgi:hypothetical protein
MLSAIVVLTWPATWIVTAPEVEKAIGYPVKLALPEPPLTLFYSTPKRLFEHVFGLERSIFASKSSSEIT